MIPRLVEKRETGGRKAASLVIMALCSSLALKLAYYPLPSFPRTDRMWYNQCRDVAIGFLPKPDKRGRARGVRRLVVCGPVHPLEGGWGWVRSAN